MKKIKPRVNGARAKRISIISCLLLCSLWSTGWCGKIVYPWRSTTAIVTNGGTFEVWFVASNQTVSAVQLRGPYSTVNPSKIVSPGSWVYDPISTNRYNTKITVTVPTNAPADRYDLVLATTTGEEISRGAVKVIKEYKTDYHIMHISDAHIWQGGYDPTQLMRKVSAIIDIANIIDPEMIIETGDNYYCNRNSESSTEERAAQLFSGMPSLGIRGKSDAFAATFMLAGNHDTPACNISIDATNGVGVSGAAAYFNKYFGLHIYNFIYGQGRFLMINDTWGGGAINYTARATEAKAWLDSVGWGNFILAAGHGKGSGMDQTILKTSPKLKLILAGHEHTAGDNNPYPTNGINQYVADSIRDPGRFEFNLFKVNGSNGTAQAVGAASARVQVIQTANNATIISNWAGWIPNLSLRYAQTNNGTLTANTATISNKYGFAISGARARFVMKRGAYAVTNGVGTIKQQFDGTLSGVNVTVVDVSVNLNANSTTVVSIGASGGPAVTLPVVSFAAPVNLTVQQGTNLYVKVNATDPDGISRVYLYKNGVPLANSEGGAPYEWNAVGQHEDPELMNLQPGTFTLKAKAVDTVGSYTEKTVTITVQATNQPPYFTANPFTKPDATAGTAYSQSISAQAVDPEGGTKTFSKVSGPVWLSLTSAGTAQGTPGSVDVGTNSFMVKVADNAGLSATATMKINVVAAQPALPSVGSIITLKAVNGKYVSATYSTNNTLIANKTTVSNYERFKVVNATNCVALQCMGNNKFVSIDSSTGSKPMVANRASIGSYEKFQMIESGSQIAIQSVRSTNYVSAISNGVAPLQASQTYIGSYERFTWKVE